MVVVLRSGVNMSLPTTAFFLKADLIVGAGFCNIGWFINLDRIWDCMVDAAQSAMDYHSDVNEIAERNAKRYRPCTPDDVSRNVENTLRWRKRVEKYFTTLEDLKSFEYMYLYDYKIDRYVVENMLTKKWTNDQFVTMIKTGIFDDKDNEYITKVLKEYKDG